MKTWYRLSNNGWGRRLTVWSWDPVTQQGCWYTADGRRSHGIPSHAGYVSHPLLWGGVCPGVGDTT